MRCWHESMTSSLLPDFDRKAVPTTNAARTVAPKKIVSSTFNFTECPQEQCSIDNDDLETIHKATPDWPAMSPLEVKRVACRLQCAIDCQGGWAKIQDAWQSLLVQPGSVIVKVGEKKAILALSTSPHAFIGWRVTVVKLKGGGYSVSFSDVTKETLVCQAVINRDEWNCIALSTLSPCDKTAGAADHIRPGLGLQTAGVKMPLVLFAAMNGFRGLLMPHLRMLYNSMGFPKIAKPPRTEAQFCEAMLRNLKKDVNDTMVAEALSARVATPEKDTLLSPMFSEGFEEVVAETLDDEDLKALFMEQKAMTDRKKAVATKLLESSSLAPGVASSSSDGALPGAAAPRRPVPFVAGRGLTQPEAKALFPKGVRLSKDLKHHYRWIARADWLKPAVTKTFSASEHGTDNSALLHCLSVVWPVHTARTGELCPWQLDDSLF